MTRSSVVIVYLVGTYVLVALGTWLFIAFRSVP